MWHPLDSDSIWEPKLNTEHHSKQIHRMQTLQITAWCPVVYSGQNSTTKFNVLYWCLFDWKAQNFASFNERFSHLHTHTHTHTHTYIKLWGWGVSSRVRKTCIFIRTLTLKCKEMNHQSQQKFFILFYLFLFVIIIIIIIIGFSSKYR